MSGRKWLNEADRLRLAREVRKGRAYRLPWKVLERVYGRSRWQLQRYLAELAARNAPKKARNAPSSPLNAHAAA